MKFIPAFLKPWLVALLAVMVGLMKYVFISVNDLVVLHSVTPRGATFNPPWLLTRPSRPGCNRAPSRAGALSLGR